jgi:hypothetical protein
VPFADAFLLEHRWDKVVLDMPVMGNGPVAAGANQIAAGLGQLVQEQRDARAAAELKAARDSAKTPEKFFGSDLPVLLRLTRSMTSADLPQMWIDLAAAPKRLQRSVVQQAVDRAAQGLGLGGMQLPITPDVATKIINLQWRMTDPEDLSTGVHPFAVAYQSEAKVAADYQKISQYDIIQDGGGHATAEEAGNLIAASDTKVGQIRAVNHSTATLQQWRILTHALLGSNHPEVNNFEQFMSWYLTASYINFDNKIRPHEDSLRFMGPALLVRWVQLRWSMFCDRQWISMVLVPPSDYMALSASISLQERWHPQIPARYVARFQPAPPPVPVRAMGLQPSAPPYIPPIAAAQPRGDKTSATGVPDAVVQNLQYNTAYDAFKNVNARTRAVLKNNEARLALPKFQVDGSEVPFCPAFHVKGMCNARCGRAADHRAHTEEEDELGIQWCTTHWPSTAP